MKTLCKIILYSVCVLYLFSCQDEDKPTQTSNINLTIQEVDENEPRSGGHQFVFFESSFSVVHTLLNLYPQYAFQKALTDSVTFHKMPDIDAIINNGSVAKFCYLYRVTIFQRDIFPITFTAYAPFEYGNYHVITYPPNLTWNNNILYGELQKSNLGYQEQFDLACTKKRKNYIYRINWVETDTSYVTHPVLTGNNACNDLYRLKTVW